MASRSVSLASKKQLEMLEGLSESWWDFAVWMEFFELNGEAWHDRTPFNPFV